jgi:hypothetical protein
MPILSIYVSPETLARLKIVAKEKDCTVEKLAESAVEETAIRAIPVLLPENLKSPE